MPTDTRFIFLDICALIESQQSEDLVLAEERTSKKDRQRIMEGLRSSLISLSPAKSSLRFTSS